MCTLHTHTVRGATKFLPARTFLNRAVIKARPQEHECKTEMYTSTIRTLKEENYSPMEIKDEEEFGSREYGDFDSSPTSKLLAYCRGLCIFTILEF